MRDPLTIDQLRDQRAAVKQKIEQLARRGAEKSEIEKAETYLKLLDKRLERLK